MGSFTTFNGVPDRPLLQLTATGAVDPSFQPVVQTTGSVTSVVRQPDGKLVVGGTFSEINGQVVRRLARFNANGTLDGAFTASPSIDGRVVDVALQADGRVLALESGALRRYQNSGQLDNTFTPPSFTGSALTRLLLQPDGRIMVGGSTLSVNRTSVRQGFMRLLDSGLADASFAPATTGAGRFTGFQTMAQQPDGKLLIAGQFAATTGTSTTRTIMRLTATGALDATFTGSTFAPASSTIASAIRSLAVQPDGKILAGGAFSSYGSNATANLARLNGDGTPDGSFTFPSTTGTINTVQLQPNNRILVGGSFSSPTLPTNLARLLPSGAADATFGATTVPSSAVNSLLVQPGGLLVLGGSFTNLSNQASMGLARITVSNVLNVAAPKAVADRTEAWPVPSHGTLNVAPDPRAHAQSIDLLDALGRSVRHLELKAGTSASLALDALPAGMYLLRVQYAEGTVSRRVQVQ